MKDGDLARKPLRKAIGELWRESYLGNEDERRFSGSKKVLSGAHVDFGLAAAGHTVEQDDAETIRIANRF